MAILVLCGLFGALALAGYLVADEETAEVSTGSVAAAGPLSIQLPPDWERRSPGTVIPNLRLEGPLGAGPRNSRRSGIVVGRGAGDGLPPAGLERPGGAVAEPVRLGSFEAYRHRGMRGAGAAGEVVAYTVPTANGAIVIACSAPPTAARGFARTCERTASTLQLDGVRTVPLSVLVAQDRRLAEIIEDLRTTRSAQRVRLARARTSRGQAARAAALQDAYRDARAAIQRMATRRDSPRLRRLVTAMGNAARAYAALAGAASRRSRSGYRAARSAVERAERALPPLLARPTA